MDPIVRKPIPSKKEGFVDVTYQQPSIALSHVKYAKCSVSDADNVKFEAHHSGRPPSTNSAESQWGMGWEALTTMVSLYVLALVIALMHLTMFLILDGKQTDAEGSLRQTHVAAISTLFVTLFGLTLAISLGVAFTQYLWHLLRTKPMTVGTIETLFTMRANPFLLFRWSGWAAAPLACTMATVAFLLAVVKIFPPGALTVESRLLENVSDAVLPTLKVDNIGNGSLNDAANHAFGSFAVYGDLWRFIGVNPVVARFASITLSQGEVLTSQSPCGTNCSYDLSFEGPHLICNKTTETVIQDALRQDPGQTARHTYYSAGLLPNIGHVPEWITANGNRYDSLMFPVLSVNLTWPLGEYISGPFVKDVNNSLPWTIGNRTRHQCQPALVTYDLHVKFENGVRELSYSKRDDTRPLSDIYEVSLGSYYSFLKTPPESRELPEQVRKNLKFTNLWGLFHSVVKALAGVYPVFCMSPAGSTDFRNITLTDGSEVTYGPCVVGFSMTYGVRTGPENGTVVETTRLNRNRDDLKDNAVPDFLISGDVLNEMLANVTLSTLFQIPLENAATTVTTVSTWSSNNFYTFSHPVNLYAPYGVSLLLTLPFLVLGIVSLWRNGVPAMDGSFLQMLMTTTASKKLHAKAAGGCLGGENNVPEGLKKERILFGELGRAEGDADLLAAGVKEEGGVVRRAGFGLEDEVMPLKRHARYGVDY